jgi:EmrB/QacA subfamily drug resistance transporter
MNGEFAAAWNQPEETVAAQSRWLALAVVLAGAFMILLDSTIVNVAIPSIQRDLGASYGAIEWVISGYALAYGLTLIPAGRLADRYGHKRLFLIGLIGFTLTSILCGTASSPETLIGWRVAQGAMAGILNPAILAIIQVAFPPRERGKAFGMYGAVSGVAVAMGPLLGGLLIQANLQGLDWRPIFLLNLPVGVLTVVAALRLLQESRGRGGSLDLVGVLLVATGVLLVSVPLIEGRAAGWPVWTFIALAASIPVFALFALWEARLLRLGKDPLIDIRLFRNRTFSVGVAIGLSYFAGFIGLVFALSLYLQIGLGMSALAAGMTLLPFAAGTFAGSAISDWVAQRLGKWVILLGTGLVIVAILGLLWTIRRYGIAISGWELLPSLLLAGIGSGFVIAPNVDIVLAGVPWQDAGAASGVLNTAQRLGNALGVAIVGVALFGSLATYAEQAASEAAPQLRTDLTAAFGSEERADIAMVEFVPCFALQANADDPTVVIHGCEHPETVPGDPVDEAFLSAVATAMKLNFTQAMQSAALYALGAVAATFLLVFALPSVKAQEEGWEPAA